jgi:hypothetical protein
MITTIISILATAGSTAIPVVQDNVELRQICDADQAVRLKNSSPEAWKNARTLIGVEDRKRRERVTEMMEQGLVQTPTDLDNAALIFQHGDQPSDYAIAEELSVLSNSRGKHSNMLALSHDRFLKTIDKLQRFGTQYSSDDKGKFIIKSLDEGNPTSVTDDLRINVMVPPIKMERSHPAGETLKFFMPLMEKRMARNLDKKWQASAPSIFAKIQTGTLSQQDLEKKVLRLYAQRKIESINQLLEAERVLSKSRDSNMLLLANEFVLAVACEGYKDALPEYAKTFDLYLVSIGKKPRYNPVDPTVPRPIREALHLT